MGVILKENNIVYTKQKHKKLLGSSKYEYDKVSERIYIKEKAVPKDFPEIDFESENSFDFDSEGIYSLDSLISFINSSKRGRKVEIKPRKPKGDYRLNKKKVREKCNALFGINRSKKFLAFYSVSFPYGFPDDLCMTCLNTVLTRCRKKFRMKTYLWVAERQSNGTLHFHMLTNSYMYVRLINWFMAVAIENQIKKNDLKLDGLEYTDKKGNKQLSQIFDVNKYNGVDVERCDNNRKKLTAYLTKYISKNDITFYRLPYHSSRDISQLFTAESFESMFCSDFKDILEVISHIQTTIVDSEFATVEYLNVKQQNGKYFVPPNNWYTLLNKVNECVYALANNPIFKNFKSIPIN